MIQLHHWAQESASGRRPKWLGSPVTYHIGSLKEIRDYLPSFERRSFGLTEVGGEHTRLNGHLDTIVRLPFDDDPTIVPIGVVSKGYTLVPHTTVLDVVGKAVDGAKIAQSEIKAELRITEYGERMVLSLYLPEEYAFDPGDGHPMALRLECLNSVDGSTGFRVRMGWFRLVCSNGLVVGVTRSDLRRRHVGGLQVQDVGDVLAAGINTAEAEKKNFEKWRKAPIVLKRLSPWVDGPLRKKWGFKAATRAFHIAHTGMDVKITGQYRGNTPTTICVDGTKRVPGAPTESRNLYDVSQILAWLAKERHDIQEQLEWREEIPGLMHSLMKCVRLDVTKA